MLSEKQIEDIAYNILIDDVLDYVKEHPKDYKNFIEKKRKKQIAESEELKILEEVINSGKIEIPIRN
jgi:hypothetical protein